MTKLEELKAAADVARDAWAAAYDAADTTTAQPELAAARAADVAYATYYAARDAYQAELKRTQEENSND